MDDEALLSLLERLSTKGQKGMILGILLFNYLILYSSKPEEVRLIVDITHYIRTPITAAFSCSILLISCEIYACSAANVLRGVDFRNASLFPELPVSLAAGPARFLRNGRTMFFNNTSFFDGYTEDRSRR